MKHSYKTLALCFIASISFASENHSTQHTQHWAAPAEALNIQNPIKNNRRSVNKGRMIFEANCASCHGVNATGDGIAGKSLNPKPTNLKMMAGMHPDGDFAWKIANGRGAMPAWKNALEQEEIWHTVNYIQSLTDHSLMDMKDMDHSTMKH